MAAGLCALIAVIVFYGCMLATVLSRMGDEPTPPIPTPTIVGIEKATCFLSGDKVVVEAILVNALEIEIEARSGTCTAGLMIEPEQYGPTYWREIRMPLDTPFALPPGGRISVHLEGDRTQLDSDRNPALDVCSSIEWDIDTVPRDGATARAYNVARATDARAAADQRTATAASGGSALTRSYWAARSRYSLSDSDVAWLMVLTIGAIALIALLAVRTHIAPQDGREHGGSGSRDWPQD